MLPFLYVWTLHINTFISYFSKTTSTLHHHRLDEDFFQDRCFYGSWPVASPHLTLKPHVTDVLMQLR